MSDLPLSRDETPPMTMSVTIVGSSAAEGMVVGALITATPFVVPKNSLPSLVWTAQSSVATASVAGIVSTRLPLPMQAMPLSVPVQMLPVASVRMLRTLSFGKPSLLVMLFMSVICEFAPMLHFSSPHPAAPANSVSPSKVSANISSEGNVPSALL